MNLRSNAKSKPQKRALDDATQPPKKKQRVSKPLPKSPPYSFEITFQDTCTITPSTTTIQSIETTNNGNKETDSDIPTYPQEQNKPIEPIEPNKQNIQNISNLEEKHDPNDTNLIESKQSSEQLSKQPANLQSENNISKLDKLESKIIGFIKETFADQNKDTRIDDVRYNELLKQYQDIKIQLSEQCIITEQLQIENYYLKERNMVLQRENTILKNNIESKSNDFAQNSIQNLENQMKTSSRKPKFPRDLIKDYVTRTAASWLVLVAIIISTLGGLTDVSFYHSINYFHECISGLDENDTEEVQLTQAVLAFTKRTPKNKKYEVHDQFCRNEDFIKRAESLHYEDINIGKKMLECKNSFTKIAVDKDVKNLICKYIGENGNDFDFLKLPFVRWNIRQVRDVMFVCGIGYSTSRILSKYSRLKNSIHRIPIISSDQLVDSLSIVQERQQERAIGLQNDKDKLLLKINNTPKNQLKVLKSLNEQYINCRIPNIISQDEIRKFQKFYDFLSLQLCGSLDGTA